MLAGANKLMESQCIRHAYELLERTVEQGTGEPLWITINQDILSLFHMKMRMYQEKNMDWSWTVGGFTTWNRIQRLFQMRIRDGDLERPDDRRLKEYQEQEESLKHLLSSAKDVAFNMVTTIEKVSSKYFIKENMESEFFERNGKKNWKLFANVACLDGSKLKKHRRHKGLHKKVKLSDYYHSTFYTWASLDDLKAMKKSVKSLMERGFDMLPEGVEKKKTVPRGMWNIINEGRHAICPMDNCGQVQKISKLGQHLERDHKTNSVGPKLCQVRGSQKDDICGEIVSSSDLESHASTHSTTHYQMFWVIDKGTKEVTCPECINLRHLNKFAMLWHMKDKHGWSEGGNRPGGSPLCWLCEEEVHLVDLNKHLHNHELKIDFLMD